MEDKPIPKLVFVGQTLTWFEEHPWIKPEEIYNWVYTSYQMDALEDDPDFNDKDHKILLMTKIMKKGTKQKITIRVNKTQEFGSDVLHIFRLHAKRL